MAKVNKLTAGSNMFWESSRMMLPEHKLQHAEHRHQLKLRERTELDEQAWAEINLAMADSLEQRLPIRLKIFGSFESKIVEGVIDVVDTRNMRFKLNGGWFNIADLEGVEG